MRVLLSQCNSLIREGFVNTNTQINYFYLRNKILIINKIFNVKKQDSTNTPWMTDVYKYPKCPWQIRLWLCPQWLCLHEAVVCVHIHMYLRVDWSTGIARWGILVFHFLNHFFHFHMLSFFFWQKIFFPTLLQEIYVSRSLFQRNMVRLRL